MKKLFLIIAILMAFCVSANAAVTGTLGTVVISQGETEDNRRYVRVEIPFTTHSATGNFIALSSDLVIGSSSDTIESRVFNMRLARMVTDPGATAPTDNYDIVITSGDSEDMLGGEGMNRDTSTSEQVTPAVGNAFAFPRIYETFTITLTNAGNSKTGTIILYFED
jgi:hypothetical protein